MWTVNAIDVEYITVELIDNPVEINRIKREIETTKHDNTIDKKKKQQKLKELNQRLTSKTKQRQFQIKPEKGINRVICFSPKHNITLAEMDVKEIENVIHTWKEEYATLGSKDFINYVQIFENKGSVMGCSNPHPHGQIWAQSSLPTQVEKTQKSLQKYFDTNKKSLLKDYLEEELKLRERIVIENEHFAVVVPFWAIWPYETMIISKRHFGSIIGMTKEETVSFAEIIKGITVKYDNLSKATSSAWQGPVSTPIFSKGIP